MKIGFIGLGVMGAPMARHLAGAGHEIVTMLNRTLRGATGRRGGRLLLPRQGARDAERS
jgi:3-hydroxyisobutyrate dehydrogenase-like beta-hydroxyacid dehydrogenase